MTATRTNRAPVAKLTRLPSGFVRAEGYLPIGVLEYPEVQVPDGQGGTRPRRELLPPDEFLRADFRASPVLVGHPRTNGGLIDSATARGAIAGSVLEHEAEEGRRRVALVIFDQVAIDGLPDQHQLSDGYELDEDPTPGVWEGQPYDLVQRNIRPNHVAIVRRGRAGETAALRLNATSDGEPMKAKIRVNGRDFDVPAALAQALIATRRCAYKPRRVNADAADAPEGDDASAAGMTTISAGGSDYQVPTELVLALVGGMPVSVSVGDQTITGSFYSDAAAQEEADEGTPDAAPETVPMAFNALGAGRRPGRQAVQNGAPGLDAAATARLNALEDARRADQARIVELERTNERMRLEPVLRRALGARFNAALTIEELMRQAVAVRWPSMAQRVNAETGDTLRARFELLAEEIAAGNFDELVRHNAEGSAAPQNPDELVEQARKRLNERLQNGKGA